MADFGEPRTLSAGGGTPRRRPPGRTLRRRGGPPCTPVKGVHTDRTSGHNLRLANVSVTGALRCETRGHSRITMKYVNIVYMIESDPLGQPISVRLPESLRQRVEVLAQTGRRSRGDVLREAMEREIGRLEWEYRIAERSAQVRSGSVQTISLADLNAELGDVGPLDANVLDEIE